MLKTLPTLTLNGFVTDDNLMMTKIYEYFLTTLASQSTLYAYYISSYDKLVKDTPTVSNDLEMAMRDSLYKLYDRYYNNVEPTVSLLIKDELGNSVYSVGIEIECYNDAGDKLYLSKSLTVTDGKLSDISNILDYFNS